MRTPSPASSTTDALPHPAPHRSAPPTGRPTMSHILYRIGNFAGRHPWRVIGAWVARRRRGLHAQLLGGRQLRRDVQPSRARSRNAPPTPSRTASRRRRCTPPTSSSTPRTASPTPTRRPPIEQAVAELADGPARDRREQSLRPARPTVSEDGQTAFATVGFDKREGRQRRASTPPRRPSRTSATPASRSSTTAASATPTWLPAATAS